MADTALTLPIVISIVTPFVSGVMAALIAFALNRSEQHRRTVREVFYSLKQHVYDYQFALLDYMENAGHWHRATSAQQFAVTQIQENPAAETARVLKLIDWKDEMFRRYLNHTQTLVPRSRRAYAVLMADHSQLHILFSDDKLRGFDKALADLVVLMKPMMHDENGEIPKVEDLTEVPFIEKTDAVLKEVELLWKQVAVPPEVDFS